MTLRELRKSKGLSLQQLADEIGVSFSAISNYETGRNVCNGLVYDRLCLYFNVDAIDKPNIDDLARQKIVLFIQLQSLQEELKEEQEIFYQIINQALDITKDFKAIDNIYYDTQIKRIRELKHDIAITKDKLFNINLF